jgi:hypothetical protein
MADLPKRSIGSAVGRLLAVLDTPAEADAAAEALTAAGVEQAKIEVFRGADDAALFDASGRRHGLRGRLYRLIEFSWADQAPDFAWYEAALRQGRVVLSTRVRGQRQLRQAADILLAHGGHFINHFGWFETQELARWRGTEPDLPGFLKR